MTPIQKFLARHAPILEPATLYCPEHGEYSGQYEQIHPNSARRPSPCPGCQARRAAELAEDRQRQAESAGARAWEQRLAAAGIPRRFWSLDFEDYRADLPEQSHALTTTQRYAEKFAAILERGTCLVFCGAPGTGKTHLACALLKHLLWFENRPVAFTSTYHLLRRIKDTWRSESEEREQAVIDRFVALDLLVLDEVGIQFGSETEKLLLFEVLNGRYEAVRPSLLISNLAAPELQHYLGARLLDRLRENGGVLVPFTWASARGDTGETS